MSLQNSVFQHPLQEVHLLYLMVFHKEILARAEESPNFNGVAHRLLWRELHRLNAIRSGERLTVWGCGEDLHPSRMMVFRIRSSEARFLKYPKQPSINGCFNWMNQSFFLNTWTNHQTSIHVTNSVFFLGCSCSSVWIITNQPTPPLTYPPQKLRVQ